VPAPKSLDEQTLFMSWGEVMSSDMMAISAVAKDFIVRLLGVGLHESLGERPRAHRAFLN
jgi:hypothetical protein